MRMQVFIAVDMAECHLRDEAPILVVEPLFASRESRPCSFYLTIDPVSRVPESSGVENLLEVLPEDHGIEALDILISKGRKQKAVAVVRDYEITGQEQPVFRIESDALAFLFAVRFDGNDPPLEIGESAIELLSAAPLPFTRQCEQIGVVLCLDIDIKRVPCRKPLALGSIVILLLGDRGFAAQGPDDPLDIFSQTP